MVIKVYEDKASLGRAAAEQAAVSLRNAIPSRGRARIIAATGASQFEFLDALTAMLGIEWPQVPDPRQTAGAHSFDPIVIFAGMIPFLSMILVLVLVRNSQATEEGPVRGI
jgi:hypothetical protein